MKASLLAAAFAGCLPVEPPRTCEEPTVRVAQDLGADVLLASVRDPYDPAWGGPGVALADLDEDGWLDAVVAVPTGDTRVLWNDGTGALVPDVARRIPAAVSVALADLDGDGLLDAWLGTAKGEPDLLLTRGFTEVVVLPESRGYSVTGSVADADADGDIDLFVARHQPDPDDAMLRRGVGAGGGNGLYLNEGGTLVDARAHLPADLLDGLSFQGAWLDADGDEDLDVYLVNDFGAWIDPNALLRNNGGAFVRDEACGCELASSGMGAAVADVDENGVPDLFVTDIGSPTLLLGDGAGGWYDATLARKAEVPFSPDHQAAWGTAPVDLDLDGHVDLFATYGPVEFWYPLLEVGDKDGNIARASMTQGDVFLRNRGGVYFSEDAARVGFDDTRVGRAVAVGDLDRDGRPDLVTVGWELTGEPFLRVYRTEGGCGAGVTVRGGVEDVGARVETVVAGETRVGWLLPSTTFSQSAPELIVGLGGHERAERVTVRWPSGAEESWAGVEAGAVLDL